MKKAFIFVSLVLSLCSCTENNTLTPEIPQEQTETEVQDANIYKGLYLGNYLIKLSFYCDDLEIDDSILERMQENPQDINAVIDAINCLSGQQPYFGDTLEECAEYELWLEWLEEWEAENGK